MAFAVLPAWAAVSAQNQSAAPSVTATGVSYLLPETRITATVNVTHRTYVPGELAKYADRYLRLSDVSTQAADEWTINHIDISFDGVPDTRVLYSVEFGSKMGNPVVRLTDGGVLESVNAPVQDEVEYMELEEPVRIISQKSSRTEDPKHFLTEEILLSGSNAKMAELVAKEIYDIRESRNLITRGQADYIPADGESTKYILQQLDAQEQSLLTLFTGVSTDQVIEYTLDCVTDSAFRKQILFRFSTRLGVLESDNLAGEPVWIDVENASQNVTAQQVSKKQPMLYYKVPGTAKVRIYNNRKMFVETSGPFAQFGRTAAITQDMFGKGKSPVLIFNTDTGALKSVSE